MYNAFGMMWTNVVNRLLWMMEISLESGDPTPLYAQYACTMHNAQYPAPMHATPAGGNITRISTERSNRNVRDSDVRCVRQRQVPSSD